VKIGADHAGVVHLEDVTGAACCNGDVTYPVPPDAALTCFECLKLDDVWRGRKRYPRVDPPPR
jgi:hypothetical protein